MSVIFRFVSNGKVLERFLGFFNVSDGRTANDIFTLLQQNFRHFNIETKLDGQTYDGAAGVYKTKLNQSLLKHFLHIVTPIN
jgi:hypothetical protein